MSEPLTSNGRVVGGDDDAHCAQCGMRLHDASEYHPFAACLMYQACHNRETVLANLNSVMDVARASAEPSAAPPEMDEREDPCHPAYVGPLSHEPSGAPADEHDAGIIRDLEAMASNKSVGFWPQALAIGALRLIRQRASVPPNERLAALELELATIKKYARQCDLDAAANELIEIEDRASATKSDAEGEVK